MEPGHLAVFSAWESFYVIVGSSAAALTGLQFVVITLIADSPARGSVNEVNAFGTPTVVHFSAVLLGSAALSAPWHRLGSAALALVLCGLAGIVYSLIVTRRARRATGYKPVLEDWIWHVVLPLAAYTGATGAAIALPYRPESALFAIAAAALLLLFVGIHNAWDTVTYLAITTRDKAKGE
jgi:hypothetical protein